jgi:hypothetical protein
MSALFIHSNPIVMQENFEQNQKNIDAAITFLESAKCPFCNGKPKFESTQLTPKFAPVINYTTCGCKLGDEYVDTELARIIPHRLF